MSLDNTLDRFWSKVDKSGECWIWCAGITSTGYGVFMWQGKTYKAHRAIYEIMYGIIPQGKIICHKCNNKLCVRPDHLYVGTHADNTLDAIKSGSMKVYVGEDAYNSKLTESDIRSIRLQYATSKAGYGTIAKQYGVSRSTIKGIIVGKAWKHIT